MSNAPVPQLVTIELIVPNRSNPRQSISAESIEELANSIRQHGFLGVLEGRQVDGHVELAYGARRLAAARQAGLAALPVIVHPDWSDERMQEVALVENLQREDLNPVEEAQAIAQLIAQHAYTHERAGQILGKSQGYVTQRLLLLKLHPEVRAALAGGEIGATQSRDLTGVPVAHQPAVLQALAGLSTRKSQNLVRAVATALTDPTWWVIPAERTAQLNYIDAHLAALLSWHYQQASNPVAWLLALREHSQLKPLPDLVQLARTDYEARNMLGRDAATAWQSFVAEQHPDWTCATCLFRDRRALVSKVGSGYNRDCRGQVSTCLLHLAAVPTVIPLSRWEFSHVLPAGPESRGGRTAAGDLYAPDIDAIAELVQQEEAARQKEQTRLRRSKADETQEVVAQYGELQSSAALEHPFAQPCRRCAHHKRGAPGPGQACAYGNGGLERYERLELWTWQRDDGLLVPRCSRFAYQDVAAVPEVACPREAEVLVRLMAEEVLAYFSFSHQSPHAAGGLVQTMGGGKELIRRIALPKLAVLIYDRLLHQRLHARDYYRDTQGKSRMFDPADGQVHEWQLRRFPEPEAETVSPTGSAADNAAEPGVTVEEGESAGADEE